MYKIKNSDATIKKLFSFFSFVQSSEWVAGFSLTPLYFKTISNQHYRINGIKAVAVSLHNRMELMSTNHLNLKTDTDTVGCSVLKCVCKVMSV